MFYNNLIWYKVWIQKMSTLKSFPCNISALECPLNTIVVSTPHNYGVFISLDTTFLKI